MVKHEEIKVVLQGRTHTWYSKLVSWFLAYQFVCVWYDIYVCLMSNIFLKKKDPSYSWHVNIPLNNSGTKMFNIWILIANNNNNKRASIRHLCIVHVAATFSKIVRIALALWTKNVKQLKTTHHILLLSSFKSKVGQRELTCQHCASC